MNKRSKAHIRELISKNSKIRFSLGMMALTAFAVILFIMSVFTQFPLPNLSVPVEYFLHPVTNFENFASGRIGLVDYQYIPQIPVLFFASVILGPLWGTIAVLVYIALGLTPYFPVFALGGGPTYFMQYGFGYILAFPFAVCTAGKMLNKDISNFGIIKAAFFGVLIIHFIGCSYLTVISLIRHESLDFVLDLIFAQSVTKLFYDYIFTLLVMFVSRFLKKFLWLING